MSSEHVDPATEIIRALGRMQVPGRRYHRDLPEELAPWYVYTLDGGTVRWLLSPSTRHRPPGRRCRCRYAPSSRWAGRCCPPGGCTQPEPTTLISGSWSMTVTMNSEPHRHGAQALPHQPGQSVRADTTVSMEHYDCLGAKRATHRMIAAVPYTGALSHVGRTARVPVRLVRCSRSSNVRPRRGYGGPVRAGGSRRTEGRRGVDATVEPEPRLAPEGRSHTVPVVRSWPRPTCG